MSFASRETSSPAWAETSSSSTSCHNLSPRREDFINAIAGKISLPGGTAYVTASIGIADFPADAPQGNGADAVSTLLNTADLRMYTSKHHHPIPARVHEPAGNLAV